jgi:hypothetical protein
MAAGQLLLRQPVSVRPPRTSERKEKKERKSLLGTEHRAVENPRTSEHQATSGAFRRGLDLLAAALGAAFSAPALAAFLRGHGRDEERGRGVRPPETGGGIQDQADKQSN